MDNFVAWYYRFLSEGSVNFRSLVLSLLWRLLCRDEMVRSNGSFALKVLSPHAQTFFSRRTKCVESSVYVFVCVFFYIQCIGITTIQVWDVRRRSSVNALTSSHRAFSLSHSVARSLVVTTLVLCVHFVVFKNQSFISWESFFPSSFGLAICKILIFFDCLTMDLLLKLYSI